MHGQPHIRRSVILAMHRQLQFAVSIVRPESRTLFIVLRAEYQQRQTKACSLL